METRLFGGFAFVIGRQILPIGCVCRQKLPIEKVGCCSQLTFVWLLLAVAGQVAIRPRTEAWVYAGRLIRPAPAGWRRRQDDWDLNRMMVTLPPDYRPSEDEEFMNPLQIEYFRQKLLRWRADLLRDADGTLASLSEGGIHEADITDRASVETDRALELRTRDRARKLVSKIDQALVRIEVGTYGYCEETDEPIGLRRLEARPIATMSIEAQERHEKMERVHRDD
jgi:DnaK suppressor protein